MTDRKVCTIVGMGEGVSRSVAQRFAREGYTIAMIARSDETLSKFAGEFKQAGQEAFTFPADAGDFTFLKDTFHKIHQAIGATNVLVYNAAAPRQATPTALSPDDLVKDFRVNVGGALVAAQQVIPGMKERKSGTILFTGGGLALEPYPIMSSLAVGKSGIRSLAFSLAGEMAPLGIHVATVTIAGLVKSGTHFDPDTIADQYWNLHTQERGKFDREIIFK